MIKSSNDSGIKVLSLFDGMSCGQIALERVGIKVDKYFASEIDKYAIKVTQANYPNTIQLGDINNWSNISVFVNISNNCDITTIFYSPMRCRAKTSSLHTSVENFASLNAEKSRLDFCQKNGLKAQISGNWMI